MNIMKLIGNIILRIVIITGLILINVIIWAIILSGTFPRDADIHPGYDADIHPGYDADIHPGYDADIHPGYVFLIINTISTLLCIIIYEKTRKKWKKERKELIDQLEKAFNEFEIGYIMGEEYIESTSELREIIEKSRKWGNLFSSGYKSRLEAMDRYYIEKSFNEIEIKFKTYEQYIESTSDLRKLIGELEKQKSLFLFSSGYKSRLEAMDRDQFEKSFNEFEIEFKTYEEYIESTSDLRKLIEESEKLESLTSLSPRYKSRLESMDIEARVKLAVKKHLSALRRNLDKAIRKNDYGAVEFDGTNEEISRFLVSVGFDSVDAKSGEYISIVKETVAECEAQLEKSEFDPLDLPDDGFEFEFWVADNLKKFGWDAKATAGAGDQGVDVIAVKNDIKVGIQCKLYSGSVGNKAVQEIIAARDYFDLDFAAVLTNADYTKSAKDLALKSKVKLLTQYDIPDFDDLFL